MLYSPEEAERLKLLGFAFEPSDSMPGELELMIEGMGEIEFDSIQELIDFAKEWGELIIKHDPPSIEIYNNYRE